MRKKQHKYDSFHYGDTRILHLNEEEQRIANKMEFDISVYMIKSMTNEEYSRYKKELHKRKRDKERRKKFPVKCCNCTFLKTCEKRKVHCLTECPYGIEKKEIPK